MTKTDRMTVDLRTGDSLEILKTLDANSIDSVVTDPPYGLSFMGKKWDYDVPTTELWKEVLRVLKPGGHLLSFSSSRTYHRMTVNVEDAGFEIRDQIMWVYGSGFPKSYNVGKAYHGKMVTGSASWNKWKEAGLTDVNAKMGYAKICKDQGARPTDYQSEEHQSTREAGDKVEIDNPYEGWGTALKPAHEPIVLARKPLSEKSIVDNVIKWGTGGINIDKSRVQTGEVIKGGGTTNNKGRAALGARIDVINSKSTVVEPHTEGRFPANFIHDGSDEVLEGFPQTAGNHGGRVAPNQYSFKVGEKSTGFSTNAKQDMGSAGRFFYCAKVSKSERGEGNNHPTVKPVKLMSYLVNLVTPVSGTVLDPFMGSGSTGLACKQEGFDFIGIDLDKDYVNIAKARIDGWKN